MRFRTAFDATGLITVRTISHLGRRAIRWCGVEAGTAHGGVHEMDRQVRNRDTLHRDGKTQMSCRHLLGSDFILCRCRSRSLMFRCFRLSWCVFPHFHRCFEHFRAHEIVSQQAHRKLPVHHVRGLAAKDVQRHERFDRSQIGFDMPAAAVHFPDGIQRMTLRVHPIRHDEKSASPRSCRPDTHPNQSKRHRFLDDLPQ